MCKNTETSSLAFSENGEQGDLDSGEGYGATIVFLDNGEEQEHARNRNYTLLARLRASIVRVLCCKCRNIALF
jgi:hypothetical protein